MIFDIYVVNISFSIYEEVKDVDIWNILENI